MLATPPRASLTHAFKRQPPLSLSQAWFEAAIQGGSVDAMHNLALLLMREEEEAAAEAKRGERAEGCSRAKRRAMELCATAARAGHQEASPYISDSIWPHKFTLDALLMHF